MILLRLTILRSGLLSAAVALAGCDAANTEADFLCGAQTGTPCQSLSDVDGSSSITATPVAERVQDTRASTLSQNPLINAKGRKGAVALSLPDGGVAYVSQQYRIPEKTGTLWIAPRQDEAEILHQATFVHFVIWDARWGRL